jgi:hypothetical protein
MWAKNDILAPSLGARAVKISQSAKRFLANQSLLRLRPFALKKNFLTGCPSPSSY